MLCRSCLLHKSHGRLLIELVAAHEIPKLSARIRLPATQSGRLGIKHSRIILTVITASPSADIHNFPL
jgi:hypothetical protein